MFSVSYLRGKRVTTLSNKHETGAQFTTHGTLWRNTAKSCSPMFSVLLLPTRQHLQHRSNQKFPSLSFIKLRSQTLFVGETQRWQDWHLLSSKCSGLAVLATLLVCAACSCNLIFMNSTIKPNDHKLCPCCCMLIWMELDEEAEAFSIMQLSGLVHKYRAVEKYFPSFWFLSLLQSKYKMQLLSNEFSY